MDFALTDIQAMLADTVAGLVSDHYDSEARRAIVASGEGGSPAFWRQLAELGLLGVEIVERHGGSGGRFEDVATILQQLGRALVVDPFVPTVVIGAGLVAQLGNAAQQAAILPQVASGALKLALAHDEPGHRAPSDAIETVATPVTGGWRLTGEKAFVAGGGSAMWLIVSARTPEGVSLFLVPAGAAGVQIRRAPLYDGSLAADVALEGVELGEDARLEGDGGVAIARALDRGAAAIANEAVGAMDALCALTLDYLKTRVQFGKPIGTFQVLQHRMVDMHIALEQARSMAMLAAVAADYADASRRARAISAAKVAIGRAAREIGQSAVQLHGGIALTEEYAAGHYFRRLTMIERQFGDTAWHLDRFAGLAA